MVTVAHGTAPTPEIAIRCDGDGRFGIFLPPGRYVIEARAPDRATGSLAVETGEVGQAMEIVVE